MMRAITVYLADDGSRWDEPAGAEIRDALISEVKGFTRSIGLRATPETSGFGNGGGYVQQPTGSREKLLTWLQEHGAHRDSDGPIGKLMNRMWRIDDKDREWGQAYYANHPNEGKQVQVAP